MALFFLAACGAAAYVHVQTRREARRDALADASFASRTAASQLGLTLSAIGEGVGQLADNPQIELGIRRPAVCSLAYPGSNPSDLSHIDILRPAGGIACSSRPNTGAERRAGYVGEDWIGRARSAPMLAAPVIDRITGVPVAIRSDPAPGHGIVAGFLDLVALGPQLDALYSGGNPVEFLVTSGDGRTVITRSIDPKRWVGTSLAGTDFAPGNQSVRRHDLDGKPRLYSVVRVPGTDWKFYVGEDEAAALAAGRLLERRELEIIAFGLLGFLLAALLVYRRVAKPIAQLAAAVRSSDATTPPKPVPVTGPTEVARLADDINGLISSVNDELLGRRRAEAREHELAALVDSSDDAIVGKTRDGTITSWNAGAERMYGYRADEAIGRSIDIVVAPEQRGELRTILERVYAGEHVTHSETTRLHRDGSRIDVSMTISPIEGPDGSIVGVSGIARNIGDRLVVEERLRRSEASYRLLFEHHPGSMWVFDAATLCFLAVNETAIANYGYSREEFLAMTIEDLRPAEDLPALHAAMADPGRAPVEAGEWRHLKKDGSVIDVEVASHSIHFEGRSARLVHAYDVTERRRLEVQLRQAQKMEAIGSLTGGIAHDFNNILMVIKTCAALLRKRLGDEQLVLQIDTATQRAAELTHQLLAFGRQQVLRPEVTDLNAVVEDTLTLLNRLINEDIEIVCDLDAELSTILVDRGQLGQVILNLVVNARDAMQDGGVLSIRTADVVLDHLYAGDHEVEPGSYTLLQVTDSGIGMDAETKSRAFDPFFTTKADAGGTGLGLATVYGIVKQSGGHLWLYSEAGMGTTFKLYFPISAAPSTATPASRNGTALNGNETILLVEDEEVVRPLIANALGEYGYTVLSAANGAEALRIAERHADSIDLLLTDVVMPGMNGRELAEQLVVERPAIHVLYTSGYPADTVIRHGIAEARAAFIEKPYLPDDLARKIRETLDPWAGG